MKKRGKGIAATFYGTGYGNGFPDVSRCHAKLGEQGKVTIYTGATEVGQGSKTALCQIGAEALGVKVEHVQIQCEDTSLTPDAGTAAASRQTYNTGNSVKIACQNLRQEILSFSRQYLNLNSIDGLTLKDDHVHVKGIPSKNLSLTEVYDIAAKQQIQLSSKGEFTAHTITMDEEGQGAPYWPYTFSTYCVEVEVDTMTGKVEVLRAVCAQDVGRAVNPSMIEGQIEGGFTMGMSWALMEDLGLEEGKINNDSLSNYIIPTSLDVPTIQSIIVEDPESTAPYGAKGIGEPVMLAAAPAILNAIYDAVQVRITELPASPEKILSLLRNKKK
jgi:CO/xanthine dehydrogenase Mo-binding subunit